MLKWHIFLPEPHEGEQEQDRRGEDQLLPIRPLLRAARREDGRPGQVVPHVRRGQEGGRGQAAQAHQRYRNGGWATSSLSKNSKARHPPLLAHC